MQNDEIAIRSIKKAANDVQPNAVNDFPEDKELWCLGTFDEDTGLISAIQPKFLVRVIDFIDKRGE